MKFKTQNQNGVTKSCIINDYHRFVDFCNCTYKAILHTSEVYIIMYKEKLCYFGLFIAKVMSKKVSFQLQGLEGPFQNIFIPVARSWL